MELDVRARLYLWFERSVPPAWGLFGGRDAVGPDVVVNPGHEDERHLLKANDLPLERGDVVTLLTGGGGGFGAPLEREPERVRQDVVDGYVSREAAVRDYGVVLRDDLTIDEEATRSQRA